jgi:hypothetical protein
MKQLRVLLVALITFAFSLDVSSQEPVKQADFKILDSNNDGVINPYEALDVLLIMEKESGEKLTFRDLDKAVAKMKKEQSREIKDMLKELDKNKNNIVEFEEVDDEEFLYYLQLMDTDKSKSVTEKEIENFNAENALFMSDKDLRKEIKYIFKEYAKTDFIILTDLADTLQSEIEGWDINKDGQISQTEAYDYMKPNNISAEFKVEGEIAYMSGVICSSTPARVLELLFEHPEVKTIEMTHVPGSIDDVSNLRASLYIHKFGLNTKLNESSIIASGGTDFFLAGKERFVKEGAKIGVHSWGGGTTPAAELSKKDKAHKKYLNYYEIVNIPAEFYWYTLNAATAENIHNMTEEEIIKFKIKTNK